MIDMGEPELTVYHRHLAQLPERDSEEDFRALLVRARHVTGTSYETIPYDHQQAVRLLWSHLERSGHLRRAHRAAHARLASGRATPDERAELELFLTVYGRVHPTTVTGG
ncbi:hypothetical protein ACH4VX_34350 [Streptomyces sp. NPDC020731]|uniref:hypothetical protein n=1 Tax=Streptomyces sp. NPDC020731 TaxID=3365085 RepID=UPI0037A56E30